MDSEVRGVGSGERNNENGRIVSPHSLPINLNKKYAIKQLSLGERNFGTVISLHAMLL